MWELAKVVFKRKLGANKTASPPYFPWVQNRYTIKSRYTLYGYSEFDAIRILRDSEEKIPASFSNRTLIPYPNFSMSEFECPVDFSRYNEGFINRYTADVPILGIIGAGTTNNLDNYQPGMTYRQVLFECLHGAGLGIDALDFLKSDAPKSHEMPHTVIDRISKTRSYGGLELVRFGDYYFSSHGHQRTIYAMFAIWQEDGDKGRLKNVEVVERLPWYGKSLGHGETESAEIKLNIF